jgi:hypothetical protein
VDAWLIAVAILSVVAFLAYIISDFTAKGKPRDDIERDLLATVFLEIPISYVFPAIHWLVSRPLPSERGSFVAKVHP